MSFVNHLSGFLFLICIISYPGSCSAEEQQITIQSIFMCSQTISDRFWTVPKNLNSNETASLTFQLDLENENSCDSNSETHKLLFENSSRKSTFYNNGSFMIQNEIHSLYSVANYCLKSIQENFVEVQICERKFDVACGGEDVCVRKCCPQGQVLFGNLDVYAVPICVNVTSDWKPYIFQSVDPNTESFSPLEFYSFGLKNTQFKFPECFPNVRYRIPNPKALRPLQADIRFLQNGSVYTKGFDSSLWIGPHSTGSFCMDGFWDASDSTDFLRNPSNQMVITCDESSFSHQAGGDKVNVVLIIYTTLLVCLIISSICLLATLLVYFYLWKEQNIHGWTIIAMILSLFLYFTAVSISMAVTLYYSDGLGTIWCKGLGIFGHYFGMGTYTWLNVLGFDLWRMIKSNKPSRYLSYGVKRFLWYSLYGFGLPACLLLISLSIEFYFGVGNDWIVKPEYGRVTCNISTTLSYYYYQVVTTMLLYLITLVFAILTIFAYISAKKNTQQVNRSNTRADKSRLVFGAKLSVLFGLPWIFEFIFSNMTIVPFSVLFWMRVVFTLINTLQGVGFFWVFVLQKKIKDQLRQRFISGRNSEKNKMFTSGARTNTGSSFETTTTGV